MAGLTAGVDIGGTKCLGVVLDEDGQIVGEHRLPTPRTGPDLIDTIAAVFDAFGSDIVRAGVGAPGLVDRHGCLRFAPNLPGVVELQIKELLQAARPQLRVVVDNDSTCALRAEVAAGAAAGKDPVVMVAIGTGIGGGIFSEGEVRVGRNGFAAEIGHVVVDPGGPLCPCGQRGCWERYASGSGLGWMGREAAQAGRGDRMVELAGGEAEAVRGEHVTAAAAEGDADAAAVVERFAWWLALGLANLANILDPEMFVLGGGIVESGPVLLEPTRRQFFALLEGATHRPEIQVVLADLGERAGAIGAAYMARREVR